MSSKAKAVTMKYSLRYGPRVFRREVMRRFTSSAIARVVMLHPPVGPRQWQRNVTLATGITPTRKQTRTVIRAYVRNITEDLVLPEWSHDEVIRRVTISPADTQKLIGAQQSTGVVLALPHLASWDMAGVWVAQMGMPLVTVAEHLPSGGFEAYQKIRETLGFEVYSNKTGGLIPRLCEDARQHKVVALVCDRVLDSHGIDVAWPTGSGTIPAVAPVGPVMIARSTGATLLGVGLHYTAHGIHIVLSEPIAHRDGTEGLQAMAQEMIDFFAEQIAATPYDWLVFQPFFPGDAGVAAEKEKV